MHHLTNLPGRLLKSYVTLVLCVLRREFLSFEWHITHKKAEQEILVPLMKSIRFILFHLYRSFFRNRFKSFTVRFVRIRYHEESSFINLMDFLL